MEDFEKFDFSQNYILENERLRLRRLSSNDIEALSEVANVPEIWTYFLEKGLGKTKFYDYAMNALSLREKNKNYPFVIFDKATNQPAGLTQIYDYIPELQSMKIGHTWLGRSFQGSGINKHCKYLLFEFAFEKLGMERIGFGVHGENLRSVAALKSVGCSQEGVLRNFLVKTSGIGRVDLLHFSILKNEWLNTVKKSLRLKLV